ncbi:MAG: metalloregulator ArsR/SmtB family transcription factor [Deltaproteobacteria bacterium]|nr:metalloregulator ArsR/SmtB family transcription factor [Deltaproteobacteria bacterium]
MNKKESRKIDFSKEADILKAVGHPARLKIVAGLIESECCVKDIRECLDLPQPVISQHLSLLRNKGIVTGKREGNRIHYRASNAVVKNIVAACMDEKRKGGS